MENPLSEQMLLLAATFLCGMALGALYDLLRMLRRKCSLPGSLLLDVVFCIIFACAFFWLGMGPGRGVLRLYMPPLMLLGALAWLALFGADARRALTFLGRKLMQLCRKILMPAKKIQKTIKNLLQSVKKRFTIIKNWFTIISNHTINSALQKRKVFREATDEAQTIQYFYKNSDFGTDRLRSDQLKHHEKPHCVRRRRQSRSAGKGRRPAAGKR